MKKQRGFGSLVGQRILGILRWFLPFRIEDGHFVPADAEEFQKVRFRSLNRILMGLVLTVGGGEAARYGGHVTLYWVLTAPAGVFALLFGTWLMFMALYGRKV
ncbi:MAG: hypothetical protein M0Z85_04400 [Gammaproteobacteria bacterium]|nr:hypothetical protein [Gammaproteobacteria bacterium]